jgi:hypothetical protein
MPKCVNHVLGINCKLSVDKLKSMIRMRFRVSPADRPCPAIADPWAIGNWVGGETRRGRGLGNLAM